MEEFVTNFNKFRDWLNKYYDMLNVSRRDAIGAVIQKFEELKLDKSF